MKNLALVATTLFVLIAGCASPEEPMSSQQAPSPKPSETEASVADAGHPAFADPERLCLVLRDEGLPPALTPTWKQFEGDDNYICIADDLEVTLGNYSYVGDVLNVIEYYAESDVADQVDLFRLTASIFNEQHAAPVVTRFQELTRTLFDRLDLTMPEGLAAAIEQDQSEMFDMEYGTVTLTRESYKMGHGLVVSVERGDSPS